ncbi:hypothetical protein WJX84_000063 [Apatococcus fuscideae]|uniref:Uncharacterized protein n=1 Tax=Apatococcus fuscideae TaxID=2026836 RepID=A0AAW1TEN6_9CHLO
MEGCSCSCRCQWPKSTRTSSESRPHRSQYHTQAQPEHGHKHSSSKAQRRELLVSGLALAGGCLAQPIKTDAAEPAAPAQELPSSTEEFGLYELTGNTFSTLEFSMTLPDGFQYVQPGAFAPNSPPPTSGRGRQPPPNPLKAKFVSGREVITIIVRGASDIRPTFFQVADVSQFGDVQAAKVLFVPRGAKFVASSLEKTEAGQRDTGTVAGIVPLPPQTFYRYQFEAGPTTFVVSVGAIKGKVYVAGASAPSSDWRIAGSRLQEAVNSFRLAIPQI